MKYLERGESIMITCKIEAFTTSDNRVFTVFYLKKDVFSRYQSQTPDNMSTFKIRNNQFLTALDDFIASERTKTSRLNRLVENYPDIHTTRYHAAPLQPGQFGPEKTIRPAIFFKTQAALLLLLAMIPFYIAIKGLFSDPAPAILSVFALVFMAFVMYLIIYSYFISKQFNYTIGVTPQGISIDQIHYPWNEIVETCIMSKSMGKRKSNRYLVILRKNGPVRKLDLYMFSTSPRRLSTIIEYYKALPENTQSIS